MSTMIKAVLDRLTPADIVRVYSGRPGCGCGCRGNYSIKPATITRLLRNVQLDAPKEELDVAEGIAVCERELADPSVKTMACIAWESDTRYRWLYISQQRYDELVSEVRVEALNRVVEFFGAGFAEVSDLTVTDLFSLYAEVEVQR
jgi:hypothetical protein